MLSFVSLCPHPPIILPGIAPEAERQKAASTIQAMEKLGRLFQQADIQSIILVSPHGPFDPQRMTFLFSPEIKENLQNFNLPETNLSFPGNLELSRDLALRAEQESIPLRIVMPEELDNGAFVPLYFLTRDQEKSPSLVELVYSALDPATHLKLGQALYQVIHESPERIAFIASGDLSHLSIKDAPAGYSPRGKVFDERLLRFLQQKDISSILKMDPILIEEAGECGYRSILILLGLLQEWGLEKWASEILSYEAPFGVGYAVVNFPANPL